MKVAVVHTPGFAIDGVTTFGATLALGFRDIELECDTILISKASKRIEYLEGMGVPNIKAFSRVAEYENVLDNYDIIVWSAANANDDLKYVKTHDKLPPYLSALRIQDALQLAILHDPRHTAKFAVYIDQFEKHISAFLHGRKSSYNAYKKLRNKIPSYTEPEFRLPVVFGKDEWNFDRHFSKVIVSTARPDPVKRHDWLIKSLHSGWEYHLHTGAPDRYKLKLREYAEQVEGFEFVEKFHLHSELDSIFYGAGFVYSNTRFCEDDGGGIECAVLEGMAKGLVPIVHKDWVGALPDSACFSFETREDLWNLLGTITPEQYYEKQLAIAKLMPKFDREKAAEFIYQLYWRRLDEGLYLR